MPISWLLVLSLTVPPTIRINSSGGSGAVFTPVLSGNTLASVTVVNGGSGYDASPTATVTAWSKRVDATDLVAYARWEQEISMQLKADVRKRMNKLVENMYKMS